MHYCLNNNESRKHISELEKNYLVHYLNRINIDNFFYLLRYLAINTWEVIVDLILILMIKEVSIYQNRIIKYLVLFIALYYYLHYFSFYQLRLSFFIYFSMIFLEIKSS